ncbi:hypothetical protein B0H11DRAFT_2242158 [Mycena galericulata]|nr:hypothetical protein B0H11DRAFT_2242158 [Mycena galericulata]
MSNYAELRDRPPPRLRNPAAEVYLGPWPWRQDIANEAASMICAVLPTHDLREAFDHAHQYGPLVPTSSASAAIAVKRRFWTKGW